jgi:probable rRNA maturation factor
MAITLDIQRAQNKGIFVPTNKQFKAWANACLDTNDNSELSIRIIDNEEMIALNTQYRRKNSTTNVLSFPTDFPEELNIPLLGDIVICASVVAEEATAQNKSIEAHWAHMTIHGILHLLGYDHINNEDAAEMETLETNIMLALHYPPPYEAEDN